MTIKQCLGLFCAAALSLTAAQRATAQQVDYGTLEQMFGQPVTTSATGSPQTVSEVPANMQIISADDIRRSGATNIPDILNFVAGIDVNNYGALDSEVSIRGFSQPFNPRLLVLINGRQVYLDSYGYVAWNNLPVQLSQIRQIEVVKGPASALFGFNAVSGVINIITYDPLTDKTNVANVTLGTDGLLVGSLVSTINDPGKGGVTISLGGLRTNEYSTARATPYDEIVDKPNQGDFNIDGRWKPTSTTETTIEVTRSTSTSMGISPTYVYDGDGYRTNSIKGSFAADTEWGLASIQGYINQNSSSFRQPGVESVFANQVDVLQASDLFKIANVHSIRLALEYRDNRGFGDSFHGVFGYQDYAASAMWNWQINPLLALTTAGRIDHLVMLRTDPLTPADLYTAVDFNNKSITEPTFNIGLVYQPTADDTLRWLVGQSVQAPSLIDYGLDLQIPYPQVTIVYAGDPDLKAATTTNYEMDYDKVLPVLQSTLRTAVYFNQTRDVLVSAITNVSTYSNGVDDSYSQNIGNGQALGGEIGLQGSNDAGFRWNASYSLAAVRDSLDTGPPQTPEQFNNTTPTSMVDIGFGYSWNKFEADLQGKWESRHTEYQYAIVSGAPNFTPVTINNFITLDARLGYQFMPALTLAVTGQQLQAVQTIETVGLEPERRILFSATYGF